MSGHSGKYSGLEDLLDSKRSRRTLQLSRIRRESRVELHPKRPHQTHRFVSDVGDSSRGRKVNAEAVQQLRVAKVEADQ